MLRLAKDLTKITKIGLTITHVYDKSKLFTIVTWFKMKILIKVEIFPKSHVEKL